MPSHFWFNALWVGWTTVLHNNTIMNNTTPNLTIIPTPTLNWHNQNPKLSAGRILFMVTDLVVESARVNVIICDSNVWKIYHPRCPIKPNISVPNLFTLNFPGTYAKNEININMMKGATKSYCSIQKIFLLCADHYRNHRTDSYVQRYINNRISCLAVSIST